MIDVKKEVTDKVIEALEKGGNEFRKMLINSAANGMPINGSTGKYYNGSNVLMLWIATQEKQYKSNTWLTYKQAKDLGAQVRKDEKSTMCCYFDKKVKKSTDQDTAHGEDDQEYYFLCKPFYVFNLDQIDNLPDDLKAETIELTKDNPTNEELENYLLNTGAKVVHEESHKIYYKPSTDTINLPKLELFTNSDSYYLAWAHEVGHWTGAKNRLDRDAGKKFGDVEYSKDELIAELFAATIAGRFGLLDASLENHASYLQNWLDVLKADKNAIFSACKQAFKAYDYVQALQPKQQNKEVA